MTLTLFAILFAILAGASTLLTEAIKQAFKNANANISVNLIALIVAIVAGLGGTAAAYLFLAIPFTVINIVAMIIMAIAVWIGSMIGYDKVSQLVKQIKEMFGGSINSDEE